MNDTTAGVVPADNLPEQPACWGWPVTEVDVAAAARADHHTIRDVLDQWQRGRCAVCGLQLSTLLLDHDHDMGPARTPPLTCENSLRAT